MDHLVWIVVASGIHGFVSEMLRKFVHKCALVGIDAPVRARHGCCTMSYMSRHLVSIVALSIIPLAALQGCASADDDDLPGEASPEGTDNEVSEEDIISENQLKGRELGAKQLAFNFDDGPGPRTSELSAYLKSEGVPATFFINGKNVPGRQRVLQDIVRDGHILANHTQRHVKLTALSPANAVSEIAETDVFIAAVQPGGPWLLRPPFGAWNGSIARAGNASAMRKYIGSVFWDIGGDMTATNAADWACWSSRYRYSPSRCADGYLNEIRMRNHGIILAHDIHSPTIDMVKIMIPVLKREGYTFVALTQVPSIKSRLASPVDAAGTCYSTSLRRNVVSGACVRSTGDGNWYVCGDADWTKVPAETSPLCKSIAR
jgi:peptidoglycan-N-acetylglucosamine deacetylase